MRALALAVLLFGVVSTHGVSVEGVKGHLATSAAAPAAVVYEDSGDADDTVDTQVPPRLGATGDRHDDHSSSHPSEQCASGQPHQGSVLALPCFTASVSEPATAEPATAKRGLGEPELSALSSAALRSSVVQQV